MIFCRQFVADAIDGDAHIFVRVRVFHIKLQVEDSVCLGRFVCTLCQKRCFLFFFRLNFPGITLPGDTFFRREKSWLSSVRLGL